MFGVSIMNLGLPRWTINQADSAGTVSDDQNRTAGSPQHRLRHTPEPQAGQSAPALCADRNYICLPLRGLAQDNFHRVARNGETLCFYSFPLQLDSGFLRRSDQTSPFK